MRLYYRSDHYNFAKNGIPALFFFSGLHPHYHTPEDTVDKIDFPMMVKREHLIFKTVWDIADRDERLKVDIPE
jgi:Zn-dependent M28 family amino/carboxypeptidase